MMKVQVDMNAPASHPVRPGYELRFRSLENTDPAEAERLHALAEQSVAQRWSVYEEMATRSAEQFAHSGREEIA